MSNQIFGVAAIIVVGMIVTGFFIGGRVTATSVVNGGGSGYIVIVDRFTGSAKLCNPSYPAGFSSRETTP